MGRYDQQSGLAEADIPHSVHVHEAGADRRDFLDYQTKLNFGDEWPSAFPIVSVVKGMTFILTEIPDLATLTALRAQSQKINHEAIKLDASWSPTFLAIYYYVITERTQDAIKIRSRMMEPSVGEDPCTGSAASALAAYLALQDGSAYRTYSFFMQQGSLSRTGEIHVKVSLDETGKGIKKVVLAGTSVPITKGTLMLP